MAEISVLYKVAHSALLVLPIATVTVARQDEEMPSGHPWRVAPVVYVCVMITHSSASSSRLCLLIYSKRSSRGPGLRVITLLLVFVT